MGKYSALAKKLPQKPESIPEWLQEHLDAIPEDKRTPGDLLQLYKAARVVKDDLAKKEKDNNKHILALEVLIRRTFKAAGLEDMKAKGGGRISIHPDVRTSVTDRDAVRAWAKENGHERDLNINAKTLDSLAKSLLLETGELIPGVELTPFERVYYTKG